MKTGTQPLIPRLIRVGNKRYSVEVIEALLDKQKVGRIQYGEQRIQIGTRNGNTNRKLPAAEIRDSFWHELVHAILYDMERHNLNRDEAFVIGFASRLSKAIDSARF
jgi:hypothetical protein